VGKSARGDEPARGRFQPCEKPGRRWETPCKGLATQGNEKGGFLVNNAKKTKTRT